MFNPGFVAHHLARTLVYGPWESRELIDRGAQLFGRRWRWLQFLAKRLVDEFPDDFSPSGEEVERFLLQDETFLHACHTLPIALTVDFESSPPATMTLPPGPPASWKVPSIATVDELAEFLGTTLRQLNWFADRHNRQRTLPPGPLRHYSYYWQAKRVAGSARLIEVPKWRLKMAQRRILRYILDEIPAHGCAHGFCRDRSNRSFAKPHVGQAVVVRTDLRDFFPSITLPRVRGIFRTAGYPFEVASLLASLCTNLVPDDVWQSFPQYGTRDDRRRHERMLGRIHLPQGTPTSPALANLAAYRLDCRLFGLACTLGARYTRYADDLLFSGPAALRRSRHRLLATISAIVLDEGFQLNARKTRVMGQSMRQAAVGLTLNRHINIDRREFDRLKAILYNCATRGPDNQNRADIPDFRSHLNGRVAYVELVNQVRGRRLRALYERIKWP